MSLVEATNVTMQFGGLKAVSALDMHIESGEIVALIGPNCCLLYTSDAADE